MIDLETKTIIEWALEALTDSYEGKNVPINPSCIVSEAYKYSPETRAEKAKNRLAALRRRTGEPPVRSWRRGQWGREQ